MAKKTNDKSEDKGGKNEITLTIIVNGVPTAVGANVNAPLHTVIPEALKESGNVGQSPDGWELKNEAGTVLDGSKKIGEFGFTTDTKLFLSLKAGAAGE
jgi:hypothetical protein